MFQINHQIPDGLDIHGHLSCIANINPLIFQTSKHIAAAMTIVEARSEPQSARIDWKPIGRGGDSIDNFETTLDLEFLRVEIERTIA